VGRGGGGFIQEIKNELETMKKYAFKYDKSMETLGGRVNALFLIYHN